MENLDPPPPLPPMERFSPSRGFILDLGGWGLAVPFYSDQDCSFLSNSYMTLEAQCCAVWCGVGRTLASALLAINGHQLEL